MRMQVLIACFHCYIFDDRRRPQHVFHSMFCSRVIFQLLKNRKQFQEARGGLGEGSTTSPEWVADTNGDILSTVIVDQTISTNVYELNAYSDHNPNAMAHNRFGEPEISSVAKPVPA